MRAIESCEYSLWTMTASERNGDDDDDDDREDEDEDDVILQKNHDETRFAIDIAS